MARRNREMLIPQGPPLSKSPPEPSKRVHIASPADEKADTVKVLRQFFHKIGFNTQQYEDPYPQELDDIVRGRVRSWNLDDKRTVHLLKLLPTCASGVQKQYKQASAEVKTFITLYSMLLFYVDDLVVREPGNILPELQKLSSPNTPRETSSIYSDPCLSLWSDLVTSEAHLYYGPYSTGAIQKGLVEFLMGSIIEARFPRGLGQDALLTTHVPATAAHLLRDKAGSGEVYAHFMFPTHLAPEDRYLGRYFVCIRDMTDWINFTNDIMSFYKENNPRDGIVEENTYIQNRARCEGKTTLQVLRDLCDEIVTLTESIRRGLKGEPVLEEIWENYVNGYILFHACDRRYRLKELGIVFEREGEGETKKGTL
ncbi:hypothetical protein FOPE_06409 [Fonsecaea pedrosoi]|nr:hypothetical protein FOPE_06409 [Fonsecaea pedrosoi]